METLLATVALLTLAVPGIVLLLLICPADVSSRIALVLGYGSLTGMIGIPVLMRALDMVGLPLSFPVISAVALSLAAAVLVSAYRLGRLHFHRRHSPRCQAALHRSDRLVLICLLLLIAVRVALLLAEVLWRPLFPWDATMHWATKARVWMEYLELRPFVDNADWLSAWSPGVYTDHHPGYPITVPLLQLWMTSAMGAWNESLMNLPWVMCFVALGAAFYAQARAAGAGAVLALTFTYFLLSMPLLNTHVALAGYADLLLGACYCLGVMAFHNWSLDRDRFQAVLAGLFAVSCTLIKNEGLFWLLTFVPALLVVLFPGRRSWLLLAMLSLAVFAVLLFFPRDTVVAGHSLGELRIFFRPSALIPVLESFFVHDSWHLFAYLLTGLLVLVLLFRRSALVELRGIAVALGAAAVLFLFLFLFTAYSGGATGFTAVGRISLQLVPAGMFFCLLLFKALLMAPAPQESSPMLDGAPT
jgi:hypothetical protein